MSSTVDAMAGVCATKNGELFHYLFPALSPWMEVTSCRCYNTLNNLSPMMLLFWASNPDQRIDAIIWDLECSMLWNLGA